MEENGDNNGGGDGIDSPATPTVVAADNKEETELTGVGEEGEGAYDSGVPQLSTRESGQSLLSQFPPTQEMPRAATQSPIPHPPGAERSERAQPEVDDDAMRMSPPGSAG